MKNICQNQHKEHGKLRFSPIKVKLHKMRTKLAEPLFRFQMFDRFLTSVQFQNCVRHSSENPLSFKYVDIPYPEA